MNTQPTTYDSATHRTNRDRSVSGWRLDTDKLLEHGKAAFALKYPEWSMGELSHGPLPQGFYEAQDGDYVVVNGEGVRSHSNSDGMVEVYFSYGMTWIPLEVDVADVMDCISYLEEDRINLADNIRVFGSRLESNFAGAWYKVLGR